MDAVVRRHGHDVIVGRVERRLVEMADSYSAKLGMARREFLSTASGMATAFLAFNQVFGAAFDVQESEANEPETGPGVVSLLSRTARACTGLPLQKVKR